MARPKKISTGGAAVEHGVIVSHYGVAVLVREGNGGEQRFPVKRNAGHLVGDQVRLEGERVVSLPRRNALRRRDSMGKVRMLAANLDVLGIVVAAQPPSPDGFIERAVVAARAAALEPFLVINKCDLEETTALQTRLCRDFPAVEPVFVLSADSGWGVAALQQFLAQRGRGALVGVSGVGKSSLLNALCPGLDLQTGTLSDDQHGCHTTSVSTLLALPGGGELVDTPGFRDFSLVDVSSDELAQWFPGFAAILHVQNCRFRNCRHRDEPGCVIKQALAQAQLPAERYALYLQTLADIERLEQSGDERRKTP